MHSSAGPTRREWEQKRVKCSMKQGRQGRQLRSESVKSDVGKQAERQLMMMMMRDPLDRNATRS
jgi:hypothetical protein